VDMGVRRLVFTSSYGAVHMNPNRSPDAVVDEACWSDYEFCRKTGVRVLILIACNLTIDLSCEVNKLTNFCRLYIYIYANICRITTVVAR
jgi:hypothetical protein